MYLYNFINRSNSIKTIQWGFVCNANGGASGSTPAGGDSSGPGGAAGNDIDNIELNLFSLYIKIFEYFN